MRVRSWTLLAAFTAAVAAISAVGCGNSPPPAATQQAPGKDDLNVDVGSPLFKALAEPRPTVLLGSIPELVVPNCTVQYEERQQIASEVDGKIEVIGVLDETIAPADPNYVITERDEAYAKATPGYVPKKLRRLKEGDKVLKGQALCFMDDSLWATKMESAKLSRDASQGVQKSATEGVRLSKEKLKLTEKAMKEGTGSFSEYLSDLITLTRFDENLAQASVTIAKADGDFKEAQEMIRKHKIRSSVNGIIRSLAKRQGEFVKAGDKILEVQSTEQVRLEGNLDVQYAPLVKKGMKVKVEPALPSAPRQSHAWHRQEVAGIAVTAHPTRPLVVSAGADGSALVWDATNKNATAHNLAHPVPVRSVACSPAGRPAIAVTGSDDGKVRVWDLSNPDKLPLMPKAEMADAHGAAVTAVAFSPDGKFFATAAGREVFVWDADANKKLYAVPADHRDSVTSLSFTPQSWLVTASKDRTLKVWKLGAEKAGLYKTIDHRSGAVDVLGVSKDGGRVLFDQDKSRIDLVNLADKQTVGQIQNLGPTAAFATLAVFNQDDTMLLTAGGEGELKGTLQVWTVPPAGGRGAELARLMTPKQASVTCAAFSPSKEQRFLVVGTKEGTVHLWTPPADSRKEYTGAVTYVDSNDPRYVTIRVEMSNKELNLFDRSAATVIINPGQ